MPLSKQKFNKIVFANRKYIFENLPEETQKQIEKRLKKELRKTIKKCFIAIMICIGLFIGYLYIVNMGMTKSEQIRANTYESY